ncbi:hypothetical protein THAOC_29588, partial [Thalassiosira oceanica]
MRSSRGQRWCSGSRGQRPPSTLERIVVVGAAILPLLLLFSLAMTLLVAGGGVLLYYAVLAVIALPLALMLLMLTRIVVAFATTIGQIVVALTARITAADGGAAVPDRRGAGTKNRRIKKLRARAGAARKGRPSTAALLVAVWCVASADTTAVPGPSACMAGQEHCGIETKAAPDPSPGISTPDEMFTSAAVLEQICAETGFRRSMIAIRRRQRDDPTPNDADLVIEAKKCLMLEQEWRVKTDDWYEEAARLFALSDGNIPAARRRSLLSTLKVDQHEESLINSEFYRIVHLIKLDETDEKNLLWMLSYIDPSVLERLISGDVPDLKSMQPRAAVDGPRWPSLAPENASPRHRFQSTENLPPEQQPPPMLSSNSRISLLPTLELAGYRRGWGICDVPLSETCQARQAHLRSDCYDSPPGRDRYTNDSRRALHSPSDLLTTLADVSCPDVVGLPSAFARRPTQRDLSSP